jgi:hypothetical protein
MCQCQCYAVTEKMEQSGTDKELNMLLEKYTDK